MLQHGGPRGVVCPISGMASGCSMGEQSSFMFVVCDVAHVVRLG
jgi:hypothetical protein